MRNTMLAVAIVAASWAGAFGVALGVTEWRGDQPSMSRPEVNPPTQEQLQVLDCDRVLDAYYEAVGTAGVEQERLEYLFDETQRVCEG